MNQTAAQVTVFLLSGAGICVFLGFVIGMGGRRADLELIREDLLGFLRLEIDSRTKQLEDEQSKVQEHLARIRKGMFKLSREPRVFALEVKDPKAEVFRKIQKQIEKVGH